MKAQIHDRGRGPEIKGTRITVYDIHPYRYRSNHTLPWIAELFNLTVEQIEVACAYIDAHKKEIEAAIAKMDEEERIARNSPRILALKEEGHKKFLAKQMEFEQLRREGKLPPLPPPSPKIPGLEITVEQLEFERGRYSTPFIAESYGITVKQVERAFACLDAHKAEGGGVVSGKTETALQNSKTATSRKPSSGKKAVSVERGTKTHA